MGYSIGNTFEELSVCVANRLALTEREGIKFDHKHEFLRLGIYQSRNDTYQDWPDVISMEREIHAIKLA